MTISMGESDWERGYKDGWSGKAPCNPDRLTEYDEGYNTGKMRRQMTYRNHN